MAAIDLRIAPAQSAPPQNPDPGALSAAGMLLRGLNRQQRAAVTHTEGPALVVAGPGTGKTEVVTRRVAWLIATKRARPREVLALTFTDNAAQEMQARVDVLVPYGQADAAIHTFHAFGDALLREHAFELGLSSDVRLLSRGELMVVMREHLFELGLERYRPLGDPTRFLGALVDLFSRAKDEDVSAADLAANSAQLLVSAGPDSAEAREDLADMAAARAELAVAFERYEQLLGERGWIDHSDQVRLALRLLREKPLVSAQLAARYRYVLVDELQDTNRAQLELILALASSERNVMAVGDPNQGIYGFRGARIGNVDRYGSAFDDLRTITLRRNYRSLGSIVEVADRVALVGAQVPIGQVAARRARGPRVRHTSHDTAEAEANAIAATIEQRIGDGAHPGDFAVLVRSNSEIDEIARSLRVLGIAVDSGRQARLSDVPGVRSLMALLRVVADPSNSVELYALASSEPYQVSGSDLASMLGQSRQRNRSLWDALTQSVDDGAEQLAPMARKRAARLVEHVRAAIELSAEHTSGEVLYDYLRRSGRLARMARSTDAAGADEARSVARFCELVRARARLLAIDRVSFLAEHLEMTDAEIESEPDPDGPAAVRVLTVHRAKGLEFKIVFVSGLVDGRFPVRSRPPLLQLPAELSGDAKERADEALAEERRLFYVALTRARDELMLTSHQHGPRGRGRRRPSIFIAEALDLAAEEVAPSPVGQPPRDPAQILLSPAPPAAVEQRDGPLALSFSQIDEFLTCPERYRLRYEIGVPTPAHHALTYGTAIHQAIAAFHTAQMEGRIMSDAEIEGELLRNWRPDGFLSRDHEDARLAAGRAALRRFRGEQIACGSAPPIGVEVPFKFRLGRDQVRGRIDRIDAEPDGAVITDYKSSDVRDQKRADAKARDSLQLQVYAMAHEARTGELPKRVQLHFVESGVVGQSSPDQARLDQARAKMTEAAEGIRSGSFTPRPSPFACAYCPFRAVCPSSAA